MARACCTNSWSLPRAIDDSAIHSPGTSARSESSALRIALAVPAGSVEVPVAGEADGMKLRQLSDGGEGLWRLACGEQLDAGTGLGRKAVSLH